ncbi:MAG: stage 0 sporulation protein [Erysipelotrichaceae bacterium]|nr:stage 0 sporulation protein [Erysipelotrichaceae bacterium]
MNTYKKYYLVRLKDTKNGYYFGSELENIPLGTRVVVDTAGGLELGTIMNEGHPINEYASNLELKPILRVAIKNDLEAEGENERLAESAAQIFEEEQERLNLHMTLLTASYSLDRGKILFTYVAEGTVDFRELLKHLSYKLRTRIELRQIGARDRAKQIGGIGICGLPICCTTFYSKFSGITIQRAKNQMLSLNIPKLSGQCGRLFCCLKYEDELYSEYHKMFPSAGEKINYNNETYTVSSYNVFSKMVRIESPHNILYVALDEIKRIPSDKRETKV